MKVYVIEKFVDYESSQILKVFEKEEVAKDFCSKEIRKIQVSQFPNEKIERLITGFRVGDVGVIYREMDVE